MLRLLHVLEIERERFIRLGSMDFSLLRGVMEYVINYPDLYHHPAEDALFLLLKKQDAQAARFVDSILRDHQHLATLNRRLAAALYNLERGSDDANLVQQLMLTSITTTMEHIRQEETTYFPYARQQLDAAGWAEIGKTMNQIEDPLFGERVRSGYLMLHDRIMSLARINEAHSASRPNASESK